MEQVPPHFHKDYRINEKDLIPDDTILASLPESGDEGAEIVIENPTDTFKLYKYLKGSWRLLNPDIPSNPITVYEVTTTDIEDSSVETTIASFTIPANTINDGDIVKIHIPVLMKWDSGGSTIITNKIKANSNAVTLNGGTLPTNVNQRELMIEHTLQRRDTKLFVSSTNIIPEQVLFNTINAPNMTQFSSTTDFTIDQVISITVKFDNIGTNYWRTGSTKAYKIS